METRETVTHFARQRAAPGQFTRAACGLLLPEAAHCADPSCPVCRLAIGAGPRIDTPARAGPPAPLECPRCGETRLVEPTATGGALCLVCTCLWRAP